MTRSCSVIIVNYKAAGHVRRCLASVAAALEGIAWEAIVIDNGSGDDGSIATPDLPRVRVHRNADNRGFARGVNQGLAMTSASDVLLLNPDCEVACDAVIRLRSALDRHSDCALVGPRITDPDGETQGSARGDPTMLTGLFGRATLLTRLFPRSHLAQRNVRYAPPIGPGADSVEVDWVSGACMFARRTALEAVKGFDARFFLYWEDADLCRRLRARGMTIRYVPEARVMHRVGGSSCHAPALAIRAFHHSAYLYYMTHVAQSPANPVRWLAKAALSLRCQWQLLHAARVSRGSARLE